MLSQPPQPRFTAGASGQVSKAQPSAAPVATASSCSHSPPQAAPAPQARLDVAPSLRPFSTADAGKLMPASDPRFDQSGKPSRAAVLSRSHRPACSGHGSHAPRYELPRTRAPPEVCTGVGSVSCAQICAVRNTVASSTMTVVPAVNRGVDGEKEPRRASGQFPCPCTKWHACFRSRWSSQFLPELAHIGPEQPNCQGRHLRRCRLVSPGHGGQPGGDRRRRMQAGWSNGLVTPPALHRR